MELTVEAVRELRRKWEDDEISLEELEKALTEMEEEGG